MPAGIPIGYSSRAEWIRDKQNNLCNIRKHFSGSFSNAIKVDRPFLENNWVSGRHKETDPPNNVFWVVEHFLSQAIKSCFERLDDILQPSNEASFCNSLFCKKLDVVEKRISFAISLSVFLVICGLNGYDIKLQGTETHGGQVVMRVEPPSAP